MTFFRNFSTGLLTIMFGICLLNVQAQTSSSKLPSHNQLAKEFESLSQRMREMENALLAVPVEDRTAHAKFLEQPDTGLIRLLPREKYDGKLEIRGGGSYYSFRLLTHAYGRGSDVGLSDGKFMTGFAGSAYGFFALVEDVPLESLTLAHPAAKFMVDYKVPRTSEDYNAERQKIYLGVQEGGITFKSAMPVNLGMTYLLRAIDFDNSDLLIAFRVLSKDSDGSVVLLWKKMKDFPAFPSPRKQ